MSDLDSGTPVSEDLGDQLLKNILQFNIDQGNRDGFVNCCIKS